MDSKSPRNNNLIERWHNKLKRIAKKPNPNVYELIENFKQEHANTEVSIAQLAVGTQTQKRANKCIEKDNKIELLKTRLREGTISNSFKVRINNYLN